MNGNLTMYDGKEVNNVIMEKEIEKLKNELEDYEIGCESLKLSVGDLRNERDKQDKEIERLRKEKEWLIKLLYDNIVGSPITLDMYRESMIDHMQQALKEE